MGELMRTPGPESGGPPPLVVSRPALPSVAPEEGIDLGRTAAAVYRRRRVLFVTFLVATAAALVGAFTLPRTYTARTSVIVQPLVDTNNPTSSGSVQSPELVQNQVDTLHEFIMSRSFMEPTLKSLGLLDDAWTPKEKDTFVRAIQAGLQAKPTGASTFEVTFTGSDPVSPVRIVDAVVGSFIDISTRNRAHQTDDAVRFLEAQMEEYRRRMEDSHRRAESFQRTNSDLLAQAPEATASRVAHYEDGSADAQISLVDAQMRIALLQRQLAATPKTIVADVTKVANPRVVAFQTQLSTAQGQLADLRSRYTDEHPEVRSKLRQIADLQQQLAEAQKDPTWTGSETTRPNPAYERLQDELLTAQNQLKTAAAKKAQFDTMRAPAMARARSVPLARQQMDQLLADARAQDALFNSLVERLEQARTANQLVARQQSAMFQLIDPGHLLPAGDMTKRLAILLAGAAAGAVLGLTLVGLQEATDRRVHTVADLERWVELPVLGAIPLLPEMPHHLAVRRRWRMVALKGAVAVALVGVLFLLGTRTRAGQSFIRERTRTAPAVAPAGAPARTAPARRAPARPTPAQVSEGNQ